MWYVVQYALPVWGPSLPQAFINRLRTCTETSELKGLDKKVIL